MKANKDAETEETLILDLSAKLMEDYREAAHKMRDLATSVFPEQESIAAVFTLGAATAIHSAGMATFCEEMTEEGAYRLSLERFTESAIRAIVTQAGPDGEGVQLDGKKVATLVAHVTAEIRRWTSTTKEKNHARK